MTRTVAIGKPTAEMRDRYTRVLKGHIDLARAIFPEGTSGSQIDALARKPLWDVGLTMNTVKLATALAVIWVCTRDHNGYQNFRAALRFNRA